MVVCGREHEKSEKPALRMNPARAMGKVTSATALMSEGLRWAANVELFCLSGWITPIIKVDKALRSIITTVWIAQCAVHAVGPENCAGVSPSANNYGVE